MCVLCVLCKALAWRAVAVHVEELDEERVHSKDPRARAPALVLKGQSNHLCHVQFQPRISGTHATTTAFSLKNIACNNNDANHVHVQSCLSPSLSHTLSFQLLRAALFSTLVVCASKAASSPPRSIPYQSCIQPDAPAPALSLVSFPTLSPLVACQREHHDPTPPLHISPLSSLLPRPSPQTPR